MIPWFCAKFDEVRMRSARVLLTLIALLGAGLYTGGCQSIFRLLTSPSAFVMKATPPPDFTFAVEARDAENPSADYLVRVLRSGRVEYDIEFREPRRERRRGSLDITEPEVEQFWDDLVAVGFADLEDEYTEADYETDRPAGVHVWYVKAGGREKRVVSRFVRPAPIAELIRIVRGLLPEDLLQIEAGAVADTANGETPNIYVGDSSQRVFHLPGCSLLEEIPEQNRQPFPHHYDALNFGYAPCRECQPLRNGDSKK